MVETKSAFLDCEPDGNGYNGLRKAEGAVEMPRIHPLASESRSHSAIDHYPATLFYVELGAYAEALLFQDLRQQVDCPELSWLAKRLH